MKFKKLHVITFPLALVSIYLSMSSYSGGISGRTTSGCTCHGAANSNTSVIVTGAGAYEKNQVITFTVTVNNATLAAAGFDLKCNIGQITSVGQGVTLVNANEITQSASKTLTSGTASWTFQWTAPATGNTALQFNVVGNAVNLNGSSSGDAWNFATITSIPLPVEFESFNVLASGQSAKVFWKMADQKNTDHFEVEKSTDGLNFNLLSKIAVNNNETKYDYNFDDGAVKQNQTYFYRIKEIMTNGSSAYTQIESVAFTAESNAIVLYPNIFSGNQLHIKGIDFTTSLPTLQIISAAGKILHHSALTGNTIELPENIPAGTYIARIVSDKKILYSGFIFKK